MRLVVEIPLFTTGFLYMPGGCLGFLDHQQYHLGDFGKMLVYAKLEKKNFSTLRLGLRKTPNKQRSEHEDAHSQEEKEMPKKLKRCLCSRDNWVYP